MRLPDYSLIKSVHDGAPLREAKQRWASLGRDPKRLVTLYRHFELDPPHPSATWSQAVEHWKANFAKFIDGTWLGLYANFVDLIEDCNEYTAVSTWVDDADHGASKLLSMEAAAWVWNNHYRGKVVDTADGGHGLIPDTCKFTLMCGPVANWWPREIYALSVKYDAPINYHAYYQCLNGERVANDFHDASGLADVLERRYGIYPEYVYGEVMPYKSSAEGWRADGCLAGDQQKLISISRQVQRDTQATRLFREGRLLGRNSYGAWFTSGGGLQWALYELEAAQLNALVDMYRQEALTAPPQEEPMDIQAIRAHAQAIVDICDGKWWKVKPVPFTIPPQNRVITFYHQDNTPFAPAVTRNVTWVMNVSAVSGDMLLVADRDGTVNDWWVRAAEVTGMS